jgi:hypothetical protein
MSLHAQNVNSNSVYAQSLDQEFPSPLVLTTLGEPPAGVTYSHHLPTSVL